MIKITQNETVFFAFNPRSPEFRANPYPTYRYLQTHHPIYYRPERNDWVLTRYADIVEVLQNPSFGRSERLLTTPKESISESNLINKLLSVRQESQELMKLWFILKNPPVHTQLRQIFQPTFTPGRVRELRYRIQGIVDSLLDVVEQHGEMDIINDLAYPLTVRIICDIMGILKQEEHPHFKQWSQELSRIVDIDVTQLDSERGLFATAGFAEYFRRLITQWDTFPNCQENNLINALIQAQAEGNLSEAEVVSNCILMFLGGYSTTKHLIGNGILALLREPQQLRLLQAEPSLIETTISEILRYDSSIQAMSRTALSDIQLSNVTINKGQSVHCIIAAANRDPAQFSDPDKFDITRNPNPYISFGQGIHTCIGLHLAKLEAEIAVGTLVRRFPNLALATEFLEWEETFLTHGLKSLPVVF